MGRLECELSWSVSRQGQFDGCKRQYYYARYGSWGGWESGADPSRRELYVLKQMTGLYALAGDAVHVVIEQWFNGQLGGSQGGVEDLQKAARERLNRAWKQSMDPARPWERDPKSFSRLVEHEYNEVTTTLTDRIRDRVNVCIENFFSMGALEAARSSDPSDRLSVETMGKFRQDEVDVYAVPDLAFRKDGEIHILDWKTGRPTPKHLEQLKTYVLYGMDKGWATSAEDFVLHAVYLLPAEVKTLRPSADDLEETRARIRAGIESMRAMHFDPWEDDHDLSGFPTDGAPGECRWCSFRRVCEAWPNGG